MNKYMDYAIEQLKKLMAIPSPTGFTKDCAEYLFNLLKDMGYSPVITPKGTVMVSVNGEGEGLVFASHIDTLGGMVRSIKSNGRIRPTTLGGLNWDTCDGENCIVHTKDGKSLTAVCMNNSASSHVYDEKAVKKEGNMEIIIDDEVESLEDAEKLGVQVGDFISFDPKTVVSEGGTIKSRFLDDKASAAVLLAVLKYLKENDVKTKYKLHFIFTVYEEVGHGGSASIPEGVTEMISVDMGCVGDDLTCTEKMVSICAKDGGGPYNYDVTSKLMRIAKEQNLDFAVDIYPHYGSDVETTLRAGYELRHGLIGPGVYASHNYERTHRNGLENTLKLMLGYIQD